MRIRYHLLFLLLTLFAGTASAQSVVSPRQSALESIIVQAASTDAATTPTSQSADGDQVLVFFLGGIPGLARGQTLRYTWANHSAPDPQQREFEPLHIRVKLFATDGSLIAQAAALAVGAGQFQSFDFNRDQINLPGEPGTGRLQVRLEATVEFRRRNLVTTSSMDVSFADAVEVIDTLTGRTTVSFKPKEIVVVGTPKPPQQ